MSKLSEEQIAVGYHRFLAQDPEAAAQVNAITQKLADSVGVDLREYRQLEARRALAERADMLGIDPFEYLLRFAVETDAERQRILLARAAAVQRAIGQE
jgi:hypothetical protein